MKVSFSTNYTNNNISKQNNNTGKNVSFKEVTPVVYWAKDVTGKYAPVATVDLAQRLQSKVVRILNKAKKQAPKTKEEKQLVDAMLGTTEIFGNRKTDYSKDMVVRSYYNRAREMTKENPAFSEIGREHPFVSYLISGIKDIETFEKQVKAHEIGKEKSLAIEIYDTPYSIEAKNAIDAYNTKGLNFVDRPDKRIKNQNGDTLVLHTAFKPVRKKNGEIAKDRNGEIKYEITGAKLLPEFGPLNPLERFRKS